jgi:hypothetical protein
MTPASASLIASVQPDTMAEARRWEAVVTPLLGVRDDIASAIREHAARHGLPEGTVRKKFYLYKKHGFAALINRRREPALRKNPAKSKLPEADAETLKLYAARYQRNSAAAVRAMLADWRRGAIAAEAPVDPGTGFPRGWTYRNLIRHVPSRFELVAARIGRTAAAAHRPLVYTTRRDLYVGQFYLFDDIWHDHFVNNLDSRQTGRPLEFHALDLASAYKFAWGSRVRAQRPDGTHEGLKGDDFRFLLASCLLGTGYHPAGTTLVAEHGTAAISEHVERVLYDETGGAITVSRSGMVGAAAHAGQYAGLSKGNFRFKAALESHGNLTHNEFAALPGQAGKDRDHRPEQLAGLLKHNNALMAALAALPPERAAWLRWPLCTIQQFRLICEEVYARINARTEHDLEGWDDRYLPDPRTGGMRKMSPAEVHRSGRTPLRPISVEAVALVIGPAGAVERTTRNGMIELRDCEISGDVLRYDATALPDRQKFATVVNPFDPSLLFAFDSKGRFVSALDRLQSVSRGDYDAVKRACGAAAKREAALLAPLRQRHAADAREKAAMHAHNARVLSGEFSSPEQIASDDERRARLAECDATIDDLVAPALAPADRRAEEPDPADDDAFDQLL